MSSTHTVNAQRFISKLVKHGASQVSIAELVAQGQIIWKIGPDQVISAACLRAEEFMLSAFRTCQRARGIMARMKDGEGRNDADLMAALKKYVEDTCGAIKEVDNELKRKRSSLETLLFEIPAQSDDDQVSWRNLIGRRDVIAHQLLTVDDASRSCSFEAYIFDSDGRNRLLQWRPNPSSFRSELNRKARKPTHHTRP